MSLLGNRFRGASTHQYYGRLCTQRRPNHVICAFNIFCWRVFRYIVFSTPGPQKQNTQNGHQTTPICAIPSWLKQSFCGPNVKWKRQVETWKCHLAINLEGKTTWKNWNVMFKNKCVDTVICLNEKNLSRCIRLSDFSWLFEPLVLGMIKNKLLLKYIVYDKILESQVGWNFFSLLYHWTARLYLQYSHVPSTRREWRKSSMFFLKSLQWWTETSEGLYISLKAACVWKPSCHCTK